MLNSTEHAEHNNILQSTDFPRIRINCILLTQTSSCSGKTQPRSSISSSLNQDNGFVSIVQSVASTIIICSCEAVSYSYLCCFVPRKQSICTKKYISQINILLQRSSRTGIVLYVINHCAHTGNKHGFERECSYVK